MFDHPSRIIGPTSASPISPRVYQEQARVIAEAVLRLRPDAYSVTFDTYEDDDSMDCGPLVSTDGRTVLADVSDLECGPLIEQIVERWSGADFIATANRGFASCPTTGRPQILVREIAAQSDGGAPAG